MLGDEAPAYQREAYVRLWVNEVSQQPVAGRADGAWVCLVAGGDQSGGALPVAPLDVPDVGESVFEEQAD